jgi:hypothetical protein
MPAVVLLHEQDIGATASRAGNTVGPAARNQVSPTVDRISEVDDRSLECGWLRFPCNDYGVTEAVYAGPLLLPGELAGYGKAWNSDNDIQALAVSHESAAPDVRHIIRSVLDIYSAIRRYRVRA